MSLTMTRRRSVSVPVFIRETPSSESEFVRKETFDAYLYRLDRMEQDIGDLKEDVGSLKGDIKAMDERLTGSIKALNERISSEVKGLNESMSHLEDTLTVAINRNDTRIDDMRHSQNM